MNQLQKPFIFFALLAVLAPSIVNAQFLKVNTSGKCEVAEVVIVEGYAKGDLYANELKWLKGLTRPDGKLSSITKDSLEGKISGNFEFLVYAQSGILRKVAGSISYHFAVETKEAKYRYAFTDFVFHYYAQDRTYKIVKTGNTKPLEEADARGWQKLWNDHRKTVNDCVRVQIRDLKVKIVEVPKAEEIPAETKKVDW